MYDILVVGSGPAGLTSAIYARRAMLSVLVVEKDYMGSGQIAVSECVDNYPGIPGVSGYELGEKFRTHAEQLGTEFLEGNVCSISSENGIWKVVVDNDKEILSKTVIYTAGTSYRRLEVKGGNLQCISYCAVCDGMFYKDKTVAVVGGGDTALGDAVYLSKIASKVYIIHRRGEFRANKSLQERVSKIPNIETVMNSQVVEITGETKADGIVINENGTERKIPVDGIFCAIGSIPNTDVLKGVCELDKDGYVIAGEDGVTTARGLFVAGDVRTTPLRQVVTAAADGANALLSAENYLNETR